MKKYCKYKRIIAAALAFCLLLCGCGGNVTTAGVSILEFDSVEALASVDRESLKNSENTLYKVGDNYYAFFPSTGQMELVTQVQEYDEQKIKVIETLYKGTVVADGTTPDVNNNYVTSVTTLGSVLDTRTEYLERELDNCNANMLIDGTDTAKLTEYKAQLETELQQITTYKQSLSNTAEIVVQSLQSQEVQDELVKQISALLDAQLVSLADQYAYNRDTGLVTEEDLASLEQTVVAQQEFINILQGRYEDIDALLAEKRVTLDSAKDIVDTEAFKSVITQLDTYASSYVAECERLYNNLNTKATALESLYSTLQTADNNDYSDILNTLQKQYAEMLEKQQNLQVQITALKVAVDDTDAESTSSQDDVYVVLQTQLEKHEAELAALEDVLSGTNLATIDSLADVQSTLQERIKGLENLQNSFKDTMTQQQIDALNTLKTDIEGSIATQTSTTASDLRSYIDALTNDYDNLDSNTQKSIDALRKLLDDKNAEQTAVNTAVNTLISNLDANLTAQQTKLEEQKTMLVDLIDTTAGQVQADLMNALETSVTTQEQNLAAQRDALTALINSSDADLADTLKTLFNERIDSSNTELSAAINELEDALSTDSTATAEEIAELRNVVQNKFTEAVNTAEARLTQERETLETMLDAQKESIVSELNTAIDTVDESRRADVEDILNRLQNSNTANSEALNSAVTDLRAVLDEDIAEQESKLTDAKQVLIALMSEKDDNLSALLDSKVSALDVSVQEDVNNLINALTTETANREEAIEAAKIAVTTTLRESIANQEASLTDTTATLNNFMTVTAANVDSLSDADTIITGNISALSSDLTSLTEAYNAYKQINSQTVSGIDSDLSSLADKYADYTQANDTAVTNLNSALGTLDADYTAYKDATGTSISNLDALLAAVKTTTDSNTTDLAALQTAVTTLTDDTVTDLQAVQVQLGNEVATLNNTVTNNYTALTEEVTQLTTTVNDLTSTTTELDTKVTTLEGDVAGAKVQIASLETALVDLQAALTGKANVSDIPEAYTLPTATASDLGGVCVDNDTIKITSDGKIYVDTATVSQATPGESVVVGTVWSQYEDIPAAYRDYCLQVNYVNIDNPPDNLAYKEVDETWWAWSSEYTESVTTTISDTGVVTSSNGSWSQTIVQRTDYWFGVKWELAETRPSRYKSIEKVPVQVCYYGFDDGVGNTVWVQYAVKFDIASVKKTEVLACSYVVHTIKAGGDGAGHSDSNTTTTASGLSGSLDKTVTWLDTWLGDYAGKGPDSGYKPNPMCTAYTSGCVLTSTQRQKMWDAGILSDCALQVYDKNTIAGMGSSIASQSNYYNTAKVCFMNGISYNNTVTNSDTILQMPKTLNEAVLINTNYKVPQSYCNFTDAGLAYKLAHTYGNHVWIYCGTPN